MVDCEHLDYIEIGTQRIKKCLDCGAEIPWELDKNQESKYGDTSEQIQRDYKDSSP